MVARHVAAVFLVLTCASAQAQTVNKGTSGKASSKSSASKSSSSKSSPAKTSSKSGASKGSASKAPADPTRAPQNPAVRRHIAAAPTAEDAGMGAETPELAELRQAELELFSPAAPPLGTPWPYELPFAEGPKVNTSGVPQSNPIPSAPGAEGSQDLSWMSKVALPEIAGVWHPRVVRYVEFFTKEPRGRSSIAIFARRLGRYEQMIRSVLRQKGLPEDLLWLSMVESAHDPSARSRVGAGGLWQFMPETGKIYGLAQDRWADQRFNPERATEAAAAMLSDLKRRFGTWELAMAAYNMGYGGVLSVLKRYNTNDYWALTELEASLPWETTLYVPKIIALSVVMKNLDLFGFKISNRDGPLVGDEVLVPPQTTLATVAQAAGVNVKELTMLNPELRASRTPPDVHYPVKVPRGKAEATKIAMDKRRPRALLAQVTVRAGETLADLAARHGTTVAKLREQNKLAASEGLLAGTVLLLPSDAKEELISEETTVIVPDVVFTYPDRKRVFYRVVTGDSLSAVGKRLGVTVDELRRWNALDPSARLHEGMTLQAFVASDRSLAKVAVLSEESVHVVSAGTEEFFQLWETKGRVREIVSAKPGDTLESIGASRGVSAANMERINRKSRKEALREGERVVVYVDPNAKRDAAPPEDSDDGAHAPLGDALVEALPPIEGNTAAVVN